MNPGGLVFCPFEVETMSYFKNTATPAHRPAFGRFNGTGEAVNELGPGSPSSCWSLWKESSGDARAGLAWSDRGSSSPHMSSECWCAPQRMLRALLSSQVFESEEMLTGVEWLCLLSGGSVSICGISALHTVKPLPLPRRLSHGKIVCTLWCSAHSCFLWDLRNQLFRYFYSFFCLLARNPILQTRERRKRHEKQRDSPILAGQLPQIPAHVWTQRKPVLMWLLEKTSGRNWACRNCCN